MAVKSGFIQYEYRFASRFVEEGVMERIQSSTWDHLFGFVKDTKSLGEAASFRGVLFERVAHYKLQQGGTFQTRRLNDNISENLVIGPLEKKIFKKAEDINNPNLTANHYFLPESSNFESVDSVVKPDMLLQMTVSLSHPCKQMGLFKVLNSLNNPQHPRLYFVVPPENFDSFQFQKYTDEKGKILDQSRHGNVNSLVQYALEISL